MAQTPTRGELPPNLFREEAGKMTAALARVLGWHNLDLCEDVVQDTLVHALESWRFGLPDNPAAWLMRSAKNRAIDLIRRERTRRRFAGDVKELLSTEWSLATTVAGVFLESEIADQQLRMMLACCIPGQSESASAALILKLLCGFSVAEIASAFLASTDAIEKQITRGKSALASLGEIVEPAGVPSIAERLPAVERALYLLFNEGYHGAHPELTTRTELCTEAIRLTSLLAAHPAGDLPRVNALLALMCFHGSRLPSRVDASGDLVLLENQDRSRWDRCLMIRGIHHLERAATGDEVTELHVEAAIAAAHAEAPSLAGTDWPAILRLYDLLLRLNDSPVVALNRAIVIAQLDGPQAGLTAIAKIPDAARLADYPFFHLAVGELHRRANNSARARTHLEQARTLARSPAEERMIASKLAALPKT
jgi:RNA polymerase sigma factor (sigma-70 family)